VRVVIVAGPPAAGKTAVLRHALTRMKLPPDRVHLVKLDCLDGGDVRAFEAAGYRAQVLLSGDICPDHHLVTVLGDAYLDAVDAGVEWLFLETAGLCERCSPFLARVPALLVLGLTAGLQAPQKLRSLVAHCDALAVTKTDLASQAEYEVFSQAARSVNPSCWMRTVNGLTGEGVAPLSAWLEALPDLELLDLESLRVVLPRGHCSLCTGGL
jgi:Ni2+-binding GTPase involved in maturation of urease and hydrogenase